MKKIISLLLVAVMIATAFAGCSKEKNLENEQKLDIKYTYDSIYSDFDESVKRAYNEVCDAIVNYQADVRFNTSMLEDVFQLLYTECPLTFLTSKIDKNADGSGIEISYKYDEAQHKEKLKQFNDKIVSIEKECGYGSTSNNMYVFNCYRYVSSHIKICDDTSISLFETVLNDEGSVFSYSYLFEYLLRQKDITAFHIIAEDMGGNGWGLSSAEFNGEIYYFDVGTEYYESNGAGINNLALNSKDLKNNGLKSLKYTSGQKALKVTANDFDACHKAKEWSIKDNKLSIVQYDLNEIELEIK